MMPLQALAVTDTTAGGALLVLAIVMPAVALRQQLGARVRSPSISTTQARQLPSGTRPSWWHRWGMAMPSSLAILKMLLPAGA